MGDLSTDVLIAGAGPAGLAAAVGLALQGVDIVVIDALPEAQNTSRAVVIHAATLESLDRLGVAERLIGQGIRAPHFQIRDGAALLLTLDFSAVPGKYPFALMIPQDETEAILTQRLRELGHVVRRPARLADFKKLEDGSIQARVQGADEAFTVKANYLVGTDGQESAVRQCAGIPFAGETYGSFILADVRMGWPLAREEGALFVSKTGMAVIVPMSNDRYRIVAQLDNAPANPTLEDIQHLVDTRVALADASIHELLWASRFRINHKLAGCFRDGHVVLAGDAAHVHSPAGGQGMNLGLRDAEALSRVLADALRSQDDSSLEAYAQARREKAKQILAMTERLTYVATLRSPVSCWLRNRLIAVVDRLPGIKRGIARTLAGFS